MTEKNSKISNMQFLLSILVVLIHASTMVVNMPGSTERIELSLSQFIQVFVSEGICRSAVPLLFVISGYLFYVSFDGSFQSYNYKIKRRIHSLLIPFLFWSTIVVLFYYIAQMIPFLSPYFSAREINGFNIFEYLKAIFINPYDSPLWFCQYLMVFTLLSIIFYPLLKKKAIGIVLVAATFVIWLFDINLPFGINELAIVSYLFGAVLAVNRYDIGRENTFNKIKCGICSLWFVLLMLNTCAKIGIVSLPEFASGLINNATITFGVVALWLLYDFLFEKTDSIWRVSEYSFMIFVAHHPVVISLKKIFLKLLGTSTFSSFISYVLSTAITVVLVISISMLIQRVTPRFYRIISGSRTQ